MLSKEISTQKKQGNLERYKDSQETKLFYFLTFNKLRKVDVFE